MLIPLIVANKSESAELGAAAVDLRGRGAGVVAAAGTESRGAVAGTGGATGGVEVEGKVAVVARGEGGGKLPVE